MIEYNYSLFATAWKSKFQIVLITEIAHSFLAAFLVDPIKYNTIQYNKNNVHTINYNYVPNNFNNNCCIKETYLFKLYLS